ncbi:MAG: aminotransferase class V-fold PLP-dependent enzyme [Gammaproteobacteria bacterium]|nr:aminotransferase class V-fold PLP-dependent enzyme [Gammaproteobacteria bacterium]MDH4253355.1 aminotransferase class V-fold PLP-dependent enzyme [Gammaproteobacteria bacterium]MDH5310129.1 aminotransferase class V-fold PLP-dependent enzyme [Gammaproteobacteria bacterium]
MKLSRREYLLGSAAALLPVGATVAAAAEASADFDPSSPLPHRQAFFPFRETYLNSASQHPLSRGARRAADAYFDYKTFAEHSDYDIRGIRAQVLANFARLIGVSADELGFVPSTTAGENLLVRALGIPESGGRIVTDALHFFGSFPLYAELAKQGMDVVTVRQRDGRIDMDEFAEAVTPGTRLVSVSSMSTFNGFEHDLALVSEIAHRRGALVYADIIHSAGSVPLDLGASGVDFAACASYKWLMADLGLAFVYVRKPRLGELRRPWYGYNQVAHMQSHVLPGDPPGDTVADYELADDTMGYFGMGTMANVVAAKLGHSLPYLLAVGIDRITAYRRPLLSRLREALPELGYPCLTPAESRGPILAFAAPDARQTIAPRLRAAGVTVTVLEHHFRVAPSVFNDLDDVERLIDALG